jgi:hypothetical protein
MRISFFVNILISPLMFFFQLLKVGLAPLNQVECVIWLLANFGWKFWLIKIYMVMWLINMAIIRTSFWLFKQDKNNLVWLFGLIL